MNYMDEIALRFRTDLTELIATNRRRSRAMLRIWRLRFDLRWPEDEMQDVPVCLFPAPYHRLELELWLKFILNAGSRWHVFTIL